MKICLQSGRNLKKMVRAVVLCNCVGTTVFHGTQNFEPSRGICPFPRNFYVFTEFCGIRYWPVKAVILTVILVGFRPPYCICTCTWFHHEIHDCHSGFDRRNTENIKLSLSEIFPVNLVDRLYQPVAVTGDKYCIFGRVQRPQKINCYMWKICRCQQRNLANWPAEFGKICHGKLWSLVLCTRMSSILSILVLEMMSWPPPWKYDDISKIRLYISRCVFTWRTILPDFIQIRFEVAGP